MGSGITPLLPSGAVSVSRVAGEAAAIGLAARLHTDGKVYKCTDANDSSYIGVYATAPTADGDDVTIVVGGPCYAQLAATNFASVANFRFTPDANSRFVATTTTGDTIGFRPVFGDTTQTNYAAGDLCYGVVCSGVVP
jgi:hypothetical protein